MKKVIVSLFMLASLSLAREAGTKSFGGGGSLNDLTGDAMMLDVNANVGYFAIDNMEVMVGLGLGGTTDDMTMNYRLGGNYYMGSMYGGATYSGGDGFDDGALDFRGGYLMGCGEGSTFLNLYGNYHMSMADGAEGVLSVGFGIVTFF